MNITGAAARQRRKKLRLMGVEGDPGHIAFAREALATNGFEAGEYKLFHGIAAATPGAAFSPCNRSPVKNGGSKPSCTQIRKRRK